MLPTPATVRESMIKFLTAVLRPRLFRCSKAPLNSSPSGSGPRPCNNGCSPAPAGCQCMLPNLRGSGETQHPAGVEHDIDMSVLAGRLVRRSQPQTARHAQVNEQHPALAVEQQVFCAPRDRSEASSRQLFRKRIRNRPAQATLAHVDPNDSPIEHMRLHTTARGLDFGKFGQISLRLSFFLRSWPNEEPQL